MDRLFPYGYRYELTLAEVAPKKAVVDANGLRAPNMSPSLEQPKNRLVPGGDAAAIVLEAERVALAEVEQYQRQMQELVAASFSRAERLQQRTEARIRRCRQQMTAAAQRRQVQISNELAALAGDMGADASILPPLEDAVARVIAELAGIPESS